MIENILKDIGLTINETKVYLALLELGESKTGEILKKSGLTSGKIYEILSSLQKKGLVSMIIKSGVKYFSPANPNQLIYYLEEKKKDIKEKEMAFKEILPNLIDKINKIKEPVHIEIFIGYKGLRTAYYKEFDFAKKTSTLYVFGVLQREKYPKKLYNFFVFNMKPKRDQLNIKIKKLLSEDARNSRKDHEKKAEIRYLPYGSLISINVIENLSIMGIQTEEPIFITIENKEVAKSFIEQFELLWKIAKKVSV